jgi:hypothetical protein
LNEELQRLAPHRRQLLKFEVRTGGSKAGLKLGPNIQGGIVTESIKFKSENGDEFELNVSPSEIQVRLWYSGSLSTANNETETGHTITGEDLVSRFLEIEGFDSLARLAESAGSFNLEQWKILWQQTRENATSSYLWD